MVYESLQRENFPLLALLHKNLCKSCHIIYLHAKSPSFQPQQGRPLRECNHLSNSRFIACLRLRRNSKFISKAVWLGQKVFVQAVKGQTFPFFALPCTNFFMSRLSKSLRCTKRFSHTGKMITFPLENVPKSPYIGCLLRKRNLHDKLQTFPFLTHIFTTFLTEIPKCNIQVNYCKLQGTHTLNVKFL